jgi:hypothetical protein
MGATQGHDLYSVCSHCINCCKSVQFSSSVKMEVVLYFLLTFMYDWCLVTGDI